MIERAAFIEVPRTGTESEKELWTNEQSKELLELYLSSGGWSIARLAKHFHRSPASVRSKLHKLAINYRNEGTPDLCLSRIDCPTTKREEKLIESAHAHKQTPSYIARMTGRSKEAIAVYLHTKKRNTPPSLL